jgi:hypothetical protein
MATTASNSYVEDSMTDGTELTKSLGAYIHRCKKLKDNWKSRRKKNSGDDKSDVFSTVHRVPQISTYQGCQIFLGTTYQNSYNAANSQVRFENENFSSTLKKRSM